MASYATFLFLPHFDVICDQLLNGRTAKGNLFVKLSLCLSGPIKFLTSLLERSLKASSHRYIGFSSSELAEGLTQIAVNDSNKKTVKRCSVVNFVFYSRSSGLMVSALGSGLSGLGSSMAGVISLCSWQGTFLSQCLCLPRSRNGHGKFSRIGHKLGINVSHFAAILVINRVYWFLHSSLEFVSFLRRSYFFITPSFSHLSFAFIYNV